VKISTILAVIAASVFAIGQASAADNIQIGVTQPLTGPVAASGNFVVNGARIAAEEINAAGGVLGKQIKLIVEDNKSNPTEAAAAAERLIVRDKVPVLMGAWGSSFTLAVLPKLMEYRVPMVVETSQSNKITTSGNPYVFRIAPNSDRLAEAFDEYVGRFNMKKAAFLVVNNDWGLGYADALGKLLKRHNIAITTTETMDASAQDMGAQLSKIKASGADTLLVTTEVEQLVLILKQAHALGMSQKIIVASGSSSPDQLLQQAGTAATNNTYYTLFFAPWFPDLSPNPDVATSFIAAWKKHGFDFAGITEGYRGYDGINTIAAAIKIAGKAEPEAIRDALWKVQVKGINSNIHFVKQGPAGRESGQNLANIFIVEIKDGKIIKPTF
jgi:branched-chain amino acid transport system substrate-binding protein